LRSVYEQLLQSETRRKVSFSFEAALNFTLKSLPDLDLLTRFGVGIVLAIDGLESGTLLVTPQRFRSH